jgi:hypothetical protein
MARQKSTLHKPTLSSPRSTQGHARHPDHDGTGPTIESDTSATALVLQKPLREDALRIVAKREKQDDVVPSLLAALQRRTGRAKQSGFALPVSSRSERFASLEYRQVDKIQQRSF